MIARWMDKVDAALSGIPPGALVLYGFSAGMIVAAICWALSDAARIK